MTVIYFVCLGIGIAAGILLRKRTALQRFLIGAIVFAVLVAVCTLLFGRIEDMPVGESEEVSVDQW